MATTPGGLPYPVGTDFVVDGDNAIRALAEAIEAKYSVIEVRKWNVTRVGVPTGQTLYELTQTSEWLDMRTPTYPEVTYNAADLSWTIVTPGWYDIFLRTYIDWAYAGVGARSQIVMGDNRSEPIPTAVAYYGSSNAQAVATSIQGWRVTGNQKLFLQGFHNSGSAANITGDITFVKTRA